MEMLDFVDGHDQVIGHEEREEIKRKCLNYRVVHIFIKNKKGELLIAKRPMTMSAHPGKWTSSAGGHVLQGEAYETAAHRELLEELHLDVKLVHRFTLPYAHPRGCIIFTDLWESITDKEFTRDKDEIEKTQTISFEKLNEWIDRSPDEFVPQFAELVKKCGELE